MVEGSPGVTAIETHDDWPDPAADFREILRVLKPDGRVVDIAETDRGMRFNGLSDVARVFRPGPGKDAGPPRPGGVQMKATV